MKQYEWMVRNIHCTSCINSIKKYISKQAQIREEGVVVDMSEGLISFTTKTDIREADLKKGLARLGYPSRNVHKETAESSDKKNYFRNYLWLFCLLLTLPLWLHMAGSFALLQDTYLQFGLGGLVFILGLWGLGRSAFFSLWQRRPNMNVLILLGAASALAYSCIGVFYLHNLDYLFFETVATIITLVLLGHQVEVLAVRRTQKDLSGLLKKEILKANMIVFDDKKQEQIIEVDSSLLRAGDLLLLKTGEKIPADGKILWGEAQVDEAVLTGEAAAVGKKYKDLVYAGSILLTGVLRMQITHAGADSALGKIAGFVETARRSKPPVQKMADRISGIFVPVVLLLSLLSFFINFYVGAVSFENSLMRSIAVLVIACPCALGLATPTALAVGLGMAYRKGILFKNASELERFKDIRHIAFDKTGTLTTGQLRLSAYESWVLSEEAFKSLVVAMERYSNHPIAQSVAAAWGTERVLFPLKKVEEIKGLGLRAEDKDGHMYEIGSERLLDTEKYAAYRSKQLYVFRDKALMGWVDFEDELRPEAQAVVASFKAQKKEVYLISGDLPEKCKVLAEALDIPDACVYAQQTPEDKMTLIKKLNAQKPLAMVGDGINDAPALASASVGVSLSNAAQVAQASADIILLRKSLYYLPAALRLGRYTFQTIRNNFIWGLSYNIIAIPVAAFGYLSPMSAALIMGFSDVVLVINSLLLLLRRLDK